MGWDHSLSHEVEFVLQRLRGLNFRNDFRSKFRSFLGILQDSRHLDRTCPVDVVETLAESNFLKNSLLHLRIRKDHFIVIRHSCSSSRKLAHDIEVIVFGNQTLTH